MDENLVGYLLKSLEPATQREVEAHLRDHPEARARLKQLGRALQPLAADADDPAPPPGLVLNTLARVAEYRCRKLPVAPPAPRAPAASSGWRWGRRADWLVAASLLLVFGGLCVPGVMHQWHRYQRRACADNMRKMWQGLNAYGDQHEGKFPKVEDDGPRSVAGVFVPLLNDAGAMPADVSVLCPAQGRRPPAPLTVAELERLYADREGWAAAARELAGSYAYTLGYQEGSLHFGLSQRSGDQIPILADRPLSAGEGNSPNHGGRGQNVLFIGGNVVWYTSQNAGVDADDIYRNKKRQVRAGLGLFDTVLGPSGASPYSGSE